MRYGVVRANRKEKDDNLAVEQAYVQIPGFESQRTFNRVFRERYRMTPREYRILYKEKYLREEQNMITVELEHFSLDKICDSGQCFRMRKLGDGHFSMVAGDQYLEMYQKDGVVDFCCSQEEFYLLLGALF